ncbi:AraC family transcriptional regulator [Micromonospora sp. WMMD1120]|uniref:AraC family transcriptional regulator n=1 Tax=Micromonospora sp. WMMD1120 TaxID=3016106 RepID=UPI0024170054|nr:AraC family transcriptional regulator [Micromonospora sp. WMMD1120]MDG4810642.1 AraC family transcriptional regulator [Micromonospora sp. WMMD1120]
MDAVTVRTDDVDRARAEVGRVFCPHRLTPEAGVRGIHLRMAARRAGGVGVIDLDYGQAVRIQPPALESFYLVQVPTAGSTVVRHAGQTVTSTPDLASVLSPYDSSDMRWSAGSPHRIFYADRRAVDRELARLLGRPVDEPVRLDVGMVTTTPSARAWARGVAFLADELSQPAEASLFDDPQVADRLAQGLIGHLLLAHRHSHSDLLVEPGHQPHPGRLVRRACALISDHHGEALTVGDIAEALRVSVRSLQDCFRRELHTTPTAYLRACRLDAAHRTLRSAAPGTSVTTVALQHGFLHLGRFATEYRNRFGEAPSATLRR